MGDARAPAPCVTFPRGPPRSLPSICFGYAEEEAEVEGEVVSLSL